MASCPSSDLGVTVVRVLLVYAFEQHALHGNRQSEPADLRQQYRQGQQDRLPACSLHVMQRPTDQAIGHATQTKFPKCLESHLGYSNPPHEESVH